MALTKTARNKIHALVQQCKRLLFEEMENQLQQYFGIRPDGSVADIDSLTSSDPTIIHKAELLRQRLGYLKSNIPDAKTKDKESFEQLVREQAFTILNRMASLRMAEEREIIRKSIRQNYNSEGFLVFDELTGQGKTAELYNRYTWYLFAIFDELAQDLPAVFDRYSPYAILFPGEDTLLQLLEIINEEDIVLFREEGQQAVNLWKEDETIGWIYQYYNSREEITAMRNASNAPRNSRELAVRNQFFTPRYVVQFLTDNSLGRTWYEMTKGQTSLVRFCEYLVKQTKEVFLDAGELKPAHAEEDTIYIPHRSFKDPRDISMIDPACGSMHFGLYAFDLYEKIYLECWDSYRELIRPIIDEYECGTREAYARLIPGLIIRHNIHGVDIDPRAVQIAGLSLWLRAQKSYQQLGLEPQDRPSITKANIVCAEPMPGDNKMLQEFLQRIDQPLRPLVTTIWEQMKLAGETGLLLKIEEELKTAIAETKKGWEDYQDKITRMGKDLGVQADLFEGVSKLELREKQALYQNIGEDFFDQAEGLVLKALQQYAESATNGSAYQKHLFAEDTARGFAFIDLCRKRYDVVLMNPPFGLASSGTLDYLRKKYYDAKDNLYIAFNLRLYELLNNGIIGSITDKSFVNKRYYENYRLNHIISDHSLESLVDLGWGVLDNANVEVAMQIYSKGNVMGSFMDLSKENKKEEALLNLCKDLNKFLQIPLDSFKNFPGYALAYDIDEPILNSFLNGSSLSSDLFTSYGGLKAGNSEHLFRLIWEVKNNEIGKENKWTVFQNGSPFSPYYFPPSLVVRSDNKSWKTVMSYSSSRITNSELYFTSGVCYGKRTDWIYGYKIRENQVPSMEGHLVLPKDADSFWRSLLIINSSPYQDLINHLCGQHKYAGYINPARLDIKIFPNWDERVKEVTNKLESLDLGNELSLLFLFPSIFFPNIKKEKEIKLSLENSIKRKEIISEHANSLREDYNDAVEEKLNWVIKHKAPEKVSYPKIYFGIENSLVNETQLLLSYIVGCLFGRWDIRLPLLDLNIFIAEDDFSPLPKYPPGALIKSNGDQANKDEIASSDFIKNKNSHSIKDNLTEKNNIDYNSFPINISWDGIYENDWLDSSFCNNVLDALSFLFSKSNTDFEKDIMDILNSNSLNDYLLSNRGFFDFHLNLYSRNRRLAPIYWQLSSSSGNYSIWLYYNKLNNQTLYKIANDYINPKLEQVQKQITQLSQSDEANNKLNELKGFALELQEFKEEILRVAQLPYQPNHDDGVLITAAPLHNLFRHTKWRKATEACWNKLQEGEYDWAHLAYSIWPDRVREQCKKDLSIAIAHGLEDICEVKPKEKKTRKKKEESKTKQLKIE